MKINISDFIIKECCENDLYEILDIQDETLKQLDNPELLRKNSPDMLLECLRPPHVTLGAYYKNELVAFSILYFPDDEEDLAKYLDNVDSAGLKQANYKLCIVKKEFRGNSLQYELGLRLIQLAVRSGVNILCATASPNNVYSINNIERLGFIYNKTLQKYGYIRNLYYSIL